MVALLVRNLEGVALDQTFTVVWLLTSDTGRPIVNAEVVRAQLGPQESKRIDLRSQWLPGPGFVDYHITFPSLEPVAGHAGESGRTDPIASYRVFDRGPFEREEAWRQRAEDLQKWTLAAFIASVVGTLFLTGLVLYLTFRPSLAWP